MSNKLKRESKKVQDKKQELNKEEEEIALKQAIQIHHAKYLPESEIPFSGAEFMMLMEALEETMRNFSNSTYDLSGQRNGFSLPDSLTKLSEYLGMMQLKHRQNWEEGIAIPHEDYVKAMNERAAIHKARQDADAKSEELEADHNDLPDIEEQVTEEPKVIELSSKK